MGIEKTLSSIDVYICASKTEGTPAPVLEAMACGIPVITTNATCGPDIIEHGKEGFIIEPANEAQLRSAIEYFITEPKLAASMGVSARLKAETMSWDAYGERWKEVLEINI